ncbi:GntR family transcriptional regulator, partial [Actinotignum timonense]|nr:GntR family transcriptional regulator [Actinotignum timonense]
MEFSSAVPIYVQLAEDLRRRILSGELGPGEKVMSTTEYAATYRINPATANKAFSLLVEEGILEKRRGIGMFVTALVAMAGALAICYGSLWLFERFM